MITNSFSLYQNLAIKQLEEVAIKELNLSVDELMLRAGRAAFRILQQKWPQAKNIVVVCGKGNNAGDGYVVASCAHAAGLQVQVLSLVPISELKDATAKAAQICVQQGIAVKPFTLEKASEELATADVVVDALLGTGLRGELQRDFQAAIVAINLAAQKKTMAILALDVPSGLSADSGAASKMIEDDEALAVRANVTITFIGLKCGLFTGMAAEFCGEVICDDLDLPATIFSHVKEVKEYAQLLDAKAVRRLLPARLRYANKGNFGHVLVVGGDHGMGGAVRMAAEAAVRSGAGLVSVATRVQHAAAISGARPEIMCHAVEKAKELTPLLERATCVVIGPGLGRSKWSEKLWFKVMESKLPLVVDADALNLLAELAGAEDVCGCKHQSCCACHVSAAPLVQRGNWILTPHPGEAARLLKLAAAQVVQNDRYAALAKLQKYYGGAIVLKGAGTLIKGDGVWVGEGKGEGESGNKDKAKNDDICGITVCPYGNPGMASGGMGDILSGVISGLVAQGMSLDAAAQLGVCIHAQAGDRAAADGGERGLLAMDLVPYIRQLLN